VQTSHFRLKEVAKNGDDDELRVISRTDYLYFARNSELKFLMVSTTESIWSSGGRNVVRKWKVPSF